MAIIVSSSPVHVSETRSYMLEVRVVNCLAGSCTMKSHGHRSFHMTSPRHLSHQDPRGPAHMHTIPSVLVYFCSCDKKKQKPPWPKATWGKKGVLSQLRVLGHSPTLKGSQGRSSNIHSQEQRVAILLLAADFLYSYMLQDSLNREWYHPLWAGPS